MTTASEIAGEGGRLGRTVLWAAAVLVLATVPYLGALHAGFVYDDLAAVVQNPVVRGPFDLTTFFTTGFWGEGEDANQGSYRPLAVLSFWLDARAGGGAAWVFHLTNVLWHGAACVALFLVLGRRLPHAVAASAAALFAVHAVHAENVAGIVGRADVMALALALPAWLLAHARRPAHAAWCGVPLLLALLAKETALVLPLVVLAQWLLGLGSHGAPRRTGWWALAGMTAAVVLYFALRAHALGRVDVTVSPQSNPLVGAPWDARLWTAASLFGRALGLLVAPLQLSPDYSLAEIMPLADPFEPEALAGLAAAVLLPLGAVGWRRTRPALALGLLILVLAYAPVANLFVLLPTIFGERLLYWPSLGFALCVAALLFEARRDGPGHEAASVPASERGHRTPRDTGARRSLIAVIAVAAIVLVCAAHATRAALRTQDWRSAHALFSAATRTSPRSARNWNNLGVAELERRAPRAAADAFARALELYPTWALCRSYLGIALDTAGDPRGAERAFEAAHAAAPLDPRIGTNLVLFHARRGHGARASEVLRRMEAAGLGAAHLARLRAAVERAAARFQPAATVTPPR